MSVEFDSREVLKSFLKERNETLVHVVEMLNAKHPEKTTTSQNVTNKLMRNTIRFSEIMEIADILGYEVCFRAKAAKPKQGYIEETEHTEQANDEYKRKSVSPKSEITDILNRVNIPFIVTKTKYFTDVVIIGAECKEAIDEYNEMSTTKDYVFEQRGLVAELILFSMLENKFRVTIYPSGNDHFIRYFPE